MVADSGGRTGSPRWTRRWRGGRGTSNLRRLGAGLAGVALASSGLAACGTSNAATGPVTLNFYQYPDVSGATNTMVKNCDNQAHGKYVISYQQLPAGADGQRLQLVRRLAAHDPTIDIMALDVTWEAEFANAGWIVPWTGANKAAVVNGTLKPALETAMWKGQLVAAPNNTNTQLLSPLLARARQGGTGRSRPAGRQVGDRSGNEPVRCRAGA